MIIAIIALIFNSSTFAVEINGSDWKIKSGSLIYSDGGQAGYKTGIGLRGGFGGGITLKHFIKSNRALEGIVSTAWRYGGIRITGLYEIHKPFPAVEGLDWFYGMGAHLGVYDGGYAALGIDAILGLEYQITEIPFTIGVDIKPFFDFIGIRGNFIDAAFCVRYTIK